VCVAGLVLAIAMQRWVYPTFAAHGSQFAGGS
jgi:hypothetical protein